MYQPRACYQSDILEIQETLRGNNAGFANFPARCWKVLRDRRYLYLPAQIEWGSWLTVQFGRNFQSSRPELSWTRWWRWRSNCSLSFWSIHPFYDGMGVQAESIKYPSYLNTFVVLQKLPSDSSSSHIIRTKLTIIGFASRRPWNEMGRAADVHDRWSANKPLGETICADRNLKKILMADMKILLRDNYSFTSEVVE